jgi:hemoglobin
MGLAGVVVLLLGVLAGLVGCASAPTTPAPSVYKQLGGREGISVIVDDFVANVVADNRINERFKALQPAQVAKLK